MDDITRQRRVAVSSICTFDHDARKFATKLYEGSSYRVLLETVRLCVRWEAIAIMHRSMAILIPETIETVWLKPWAEELQGSYETPIVLGGVLGLLQAGIELDERSNYGPNPYHPVLMRFLFSTLLANEVSFEKAMKPWCGWEKQFHQALDAYFFSPKRSNLRAKQAELFWERLSIQDVEAGFSRFMTKAAFGVFTETIAHA